jgi:O-antigen ligase
MLSNNLELVLARYLSIGASVITLFVLAGPVSDPVNVTKLLAGGIVAFGVLPLLLKRETRSLIASHRLLLGLLVCFSLFSLISSVVSEAPFVQNFYGDSGRNTGFLTYLILCLILLGSALISQGSSFKRILIWFLVAGLANVILGYWSWVLGDPIPWNNIYGNLLGTFGNPNFMGAFLGMFSAVLAVLILSEKLEVKWRLFAGSLWIATIPIMLQTKAVQGVLLTLGGAGLALLLFLHYKFRKTWLSILYGSAFVSSATLAVLGALQIGPLAQYVYKRSVSLRGSYWNAAIEMGSNNPLTGVGMDAYGTFYRQYRSENAATVMPGPEVASNAAHSVPLDFLAFGGVPLFVIYVGILLIGLTSLIKVLHRKKDFDPVFLSLAMIWLTYQIQSLISINQLGLAIWGWVATGALVAYERITRSPAVLQESISKGSTKSKVNTKQELFTPALLAAIGSGVGILIAIPPLTADASYRNAIKYQNLEKLEAALVPGYFKPRNSRTLGNAVQILEESKLYEPAIKYAREGVKFSPMAFDAWKALYYATNATPDEKSRAKVQMIKLDPLNVALKDLP